MNIINDISNSFGVFFTNLYEGTMAFVPSLLLILFCLGAALLIEFLFKVIFRAIGLNRWLAKNGMLKTLKAIGVEPQSHVVIANLIFWVVFLILIQGVASISGWASISGKFKDYAGMIPLLIGGIIIVAIGLHISRFISKIAKAILHKAESKSASLLSSIVFYALMTIVITTALNFIGVSTKLITANVTVIIGSVLLSFSIAFVFGSKDLLKNILSSSYNKNNYKVGQKIAIDDIKGEIIKITNISVIVKTSNKVRVIPAKRFTDDVVDILS
jgi:Mechanosensitive ion channel, conserved TM helix